MSDFEIPDADDADVILDKRVFAKPEPVITCERMHCGVCDKWVYVCDCHDMEVAWVFTGSIVCSKSCWELFQVKWNMRDYKPKSYWRRVNALRRGQGEKTDLEPQKGMRGWEFSLCQECKGTGIREEGRPDE